MSPRLRRTLCTIPLLLTLSACGSSGDPTGQAGRDDSLEVTAAFYPLQYLAERVGGSHVAVTSLAAPGAEPHDLELTPKQVGGLRDAGAVLYLKGFQPAVDEAVAQADAGRVLDIAPAVHLEEHAESEGAHDHGAGEGHAEESHEADVTEEGHEGESAQEHAAHADEGHDHSHEGPDPHFWLDPLRYADAADAVATQLSKADPDHRADFEKNAAALRDELERLDKDFTEGLKTCDSRTIVTGHEAFGYLAERYDLEQTGIAGLTGGEVSPARLAEMTAFVKEHDVHTVYSEVLLDPKIARTVAEETGAEVRRLDPVEAITDESAGATYPEVMRANLESLTAGQGCR